MKLNSGITTIPSFLNLPNFGRGFHVRDEDQAKRLLNSYTKLDHPSCAVRVHYTKSGIGAEKASDVYVLTDGDAFDMSGLLEESQYQQELPKDKKDNYCFKSAITSILRKECGFDKWVDSVDVIELAEPVL